MSLEYVGTGTQQGFTKSLAESGAQLTLQRFKLGDLSAFTKEKSFPPDDSEDFRVFYVGRDDVHGVLKFLLERCTRSLKMNQFGFDDEELSALIESHIASEHIFVQGTLDKSQAGGVHERKILAAWDLDMRNSFVVGQSATHQISHTKGGVIDGVVAWEGSTNWSASGEGIGIGLHGAANAPGFKAQNNTLAIFVHPVQIQKFTTELDEEHVIALQQQIKSAASPHKSAT